MSWVNYDNTSSTASAWYTPRGGSSVKDEINEIKKEMDTIAKEREEDKEKYLPIFDPKELDL